MFPPPRNYGSNELVSKSERVSAFLRVLANGKRLQILGRLMGVREMSVSDLACAVGLGQSALSQHLTKLRLEGIVETRRVSQIIYYRLSKDTRIRRVLSPLMRLFRS